LGHKAGAEWGVWNGARDNAQLAIESEGKNLREKAKTKDKYGWQTPKCDTTCKYLNIIR